MIASDELPSRLLPRVRDIAEEAGRLAMRFFHPERSTSARIWSKAGGSPVTEADVAVDTYLKVHLSQLLPEAGWLSEETTDDRRRLERDLVWIVDPIDGTRAFLGGNRDWSVAIGLLVAGRPVLGIVNAPAHETLYEATAGRGAFRNGSRMAVSARHDLDTASVAGPVPFVDRLARRYPALTRAPRIPSLALRIARVAEGAVDVGLVSSNARDWDIAAADMILSEAGGALFDLDGLPIGYNRLEPVHPEMMASPSQLQHGLIDAIRA
ncbi:3'(2'),5'-bisphosphate nucleotidase CysQ [Enterovirga rhinocerotis]|uniref:Myo-inositol-1(Or 4)-monophosphatase n=1 Tax=Enterovirga rhinocerotis TaxID=1339210 RepID=A0A4R7C7E0_9HYPH|nr:3'(2'),5'-bisphosphate nucleotidase CysQ [Enterovirga rhinocerotis]TDR93892.1 myo-inositol-1(or 4)-monophosphatase [Enterovirga rhinocerotis]